MVLPWSSLSIIVASDLVEAVLDCSSEGILESEEERLALAIRARCICDSVVDEGRCHLKNSAAWFTSPRCRSSTRAWRLSSGKVKVSVLVLKFQPTTLRM